MCWQVVLMGDAAHSMAPTLGQACNCGLEDAQVFAGRSRMAKLLQTVVVLMPCQS